MPSKTSTIKTNSQKQKILPWITCDEGMSIRLSHSVQIILTDYVQSATASGILLTECNSIRNFIRQTPTRIVAYFCFFSLSLSLIAFFSLSLTLFSLLFQSLSLPPLLPFPTTIHNSLIHLSETKKIENMINEKIWRDVTYVVWGRKFISVHREKPCALSKISKNGSSGTSANRRRRKEGPNYSWKRWENYTYTSLH